MDAAAKAIDNRETVQQHLGRTDLHPVRARRAAAFHARRQVEQIADGPAIERQLVDSKLVLDVGDLHAFERDHRGRGRYLHRGGQRADLQHRIDYGRLPDFERQRAHPLFEALGFDGQLVFAGLDIAEIIEAGHRDGSLAADVGVLVSKSDLGLRDRGACEAS